MTRIWIAELPTRHFEFKAAGTTEDSARQALRETVRLHLRQYAGPEVAGLRGLARMESDFWADYADSVTCESIALDGPGLRDWFNMGPPA